MGISKDHPDVPLQVHARYSRIEILAAFGIGDGAKVVEWREGVYDAKSAGADILAFTLDKSTGKFSPTTRYRDYAISPSLIHWESQSGSAPIAQPVFVTATTDHWPHNYVVHASTRR